MKNTILITGAAGYIGSILAETLSGSDDEIVLFDKNKLKHMNAFSTSICVEGDIANENDVNMLFAKYNPSIVIHLAAVSGVRLTEREKLDIKRTNEYGTDVLIRTMKNYSCENIIFSSSCAVYGNHPYECFETTKTDPISLYGKSKLYAENKLLNSGLNCTILRLGNVIGSNESNTLGSKNQTIIRSYTDTVHGKRNSLEIYGKSFPSEDGTAVRSFVHVLDVVTIIDMILKNRLYKSKHHILNISAYTMTIYQVVDELIKIFKQPVNVTFKNRRKTEIGISRINSNKMKNLLGWYPKYSNFSETILSSREWYLNRSYKVE
jgi:UDP-glucose 4-epimerase